VVSTSLGDVRASAHAAGATVNDVLLATVTAGLRDLLIARGDEVAGLVLRASMPMASGGTAQPGGLLLVGLPVGEPDPARRLAAIVSTTSAMKSRRRSGGGSVFDVLRLPLPLARASVRWMRHLAARRINLFVTDVPGPTSPLFLGPARLVSAVPVAPLVRTVPLGVAALSYAGTLVVSVNADATLGDLTPLTRGMQGFLDELTATAS
jgi:diacylglycerol O-acyltransferase